MGIKTIYPTKPADFAKPIKLLNKIFSEFSGFIPYSTQFAFAKTKGHHPLIIEMYEDDQLIAYALCFEKLKNYYHIWDIGVDQKYRKKGIGSNIYNFIENYAKKNKYRGVTINTFNRFANNIKLLLGRGYEIYKLQNTGKSKKDPKIFLRLNFK